MENERAVGPSTGSFHLEKTSLTEHSSAHNNTHPTFIKYRVKTKKNSPLYFTIPLLKPGCNNLTPARWTLKIV